MQLGGHIVEVVGVAGDANEEVAVFIGVLLGIEERGRVDDIELDVVAAELEVGADEMTELAHILLATQQVRHETHVQERAAALRLVELAEALDDGRGAVRVAAVGGRGAVADGEVGKTAVGRSAADAAEIVVAGGAEHVEVRLAAAGVGTAVDGFDEIVIDAHGNVIGVGIVVAEEGGVVADVLAHNRPRSPGPPYGPRGGFYCFAIRGLYIRSPLGG